MSVRCADCQEPVIGKALLVNGRVFHHGHFRCSECRLAIDRFYYELTDLDSASDSNRSGSLQDDEESVGRRRNPVVPPVSKPGKKTIVCCLCKAARHPTCAACNDPVGETYISAMQRNYHLNCFLCAGCRKPFAGGEFRIHRDQPYDNDCYWALRLRNASQQ
ncbi:Protein Y1A5A.1 [Aphelenchoides avenae]|nr:Protein Y1A5A.1 [Aphelenchus avenae]